MTADHAATLYAASAPVVLLLLLLHAGGFAETAIDR